MFKEKKSNSLDLRTIRSMANFKPNFFLRETKNVSDISMDIRFPV